MRAEIQIVCDAIPLEPTKTIKKEEAKVGLMCNPHLKIQKDGSYKASVLELGIAVCGNVDQIHLDKLPH